MTNYSPRHCLYFDILQLLYEKRQGVVKGFCGDDNNFRFMTMIFWNFFSP